MYQQDKLDPIYKNNGIYPGMPTFTEQHWTSGVFGSIGLNLAIFRKAFVSVTGLELINHVARESKSDAKPFDGQTHDRLCLRPGVA